MNQGFVIEKCCRGDLRVSADYPLDPVPRKVLIIAGLGARGQTEFFQHVRHPQNHPLIFQVL